MGSCETTEIGSVSARKKVVVVGLGMVGVAFIEKLLKSDAKRNEYEICVFGEENHVAYNRVGLTSFFAHRSIPSMYLQPEEWYASHEEGALAYRINTKITSIDTARKKVFTQNGEECAYDILVLATGSDALLPRHTPGHDAKGVFVYRTIEDLEKLIDYSAKVSLPEGIDKRAAVVGGGLLGLEAAHAVQDLDSFPRVAIIERNRWVLSRQLDMDGGNMVVEKVRDMGVDVMLSKRVGAIEKDENNVMTAVVFEDGERMDCQMICFAIGIKARDELAHSAGIKCHDRGGILINDALETSAKDVYAIGECASFENATYGLIAPGIEMADVLAFNLTQAKLHAPRKFKTPDLSTKLKLMGVDVASFGDFFADRDGPKNVPKRAGAGKEKKPGVKSLTYKDPFSSVYKKYIFTDDGKYLLGGMMIGDTSDYIKVVSLVKAGKPLEIGPHELIVGANKGGEEDGEDLPDDAQICSCHNVTKGMVAESVRSGECDSIGKVKSCTKAGTGCGGCMPLVQNIFNAEMKKMGNEVSNHVCPHFPYSRADLFNIVRVKQLKTFGDVMEKYGNKPDALGCEVCKPVIASIFSTVFNPLVCDAPVAGLQETNDKYLGNIQRNGTYSIIPRVSAGEITPAKLVAMGQVAEKYDLYTKITGGQRIDMFGAKKQDLPDIWEELVKAGFETGHGYGKSLRTVKSCVGTTWCRYGIADSVGMAVRLEERYKSIRAPHKIKGGVSGCVRECAEAQNKDFGLIATEKGFNLYVAGNGGAKPKHSELLKADVPPDEIVQLLDRYLMFYMRTADRLQRTARWLEGLPGGIKYLREVILDDKLGICEDLEKQMEELVGTFFCEWTEVVNDPERRKHFKQFANTDEKVENMEKITDRGQTRPTNWTKDMSVTYPFREHKWSKLDWEPILKTDEVLAVRTGAGVAVKRGDTQLAVFSVPGKGFYASQSMCPHKRAFVLQDGILGDTPEGDIFVSCPMHKRNYDISCHEDKGGSCSNDSSMSIATFEIESRDDGMLWMKLPPVMEMDEVLGTKKWIMKADDSAPYFDKVDEKIGHDRKTGLNTKKIIRPDNQKKNGDAAAAKHPLDW
ncbi:nitrite reductase NiiA [Saitoella complicata NRRL Y-17804]|uniref:nitrite reductase NiiA n=1 Tax=Saitoella complicata (strain BCRC 22490 / CBS 7301 / JCM 7358 / NBRC 10748 / NRRL Y-17804) TaxID=698492 RepID=UPI0008672445|nr:nitrite reductase NiiA [Saitoella complicata NRRL Y-17804]ODQ55648.1 nitrite reductase NiiA [Saitoella complicata NRRL Y-17804]